MKTNKVLKVLAVLVMSYGLLGCSLNESDGGTLVANSLRGSATGNVLPAGQLAIDLNTGRPDPNSTKWGYVYKNKQTLDMFLSLIEGRNIQTSQEVFNSADIYFWGDIKSDAGPLQYGNEGLYFSRLDKSNFKFEITIWDYFTNRKDPSTNKKYDYLGYAYFGQGGRVQAGQLVNSVYNSSTRTVGLLFRDTVGDVIMEFQIVGNSSSMANSTMTGNLFFRQTGQTTGGVSLGNFSNLRVCDFFKCQ